MWNYLGKRLMVVPIVLLGVATIVFLITHLTPGDPAVMIAGEHASEEVIENLRASLGLDKPLLVQYGNFLGRLAQFDLGRSIRSRRPVVDEIGRTWPNTVELVFVTALVSVIPGVFFGVVAAVNRGKLLDKISMVLALIGLSMPSFWRGLLLILLFSVYIPLFPTSGRAGPLFVGDNWRYVIMPALALGMGPMGSLARVTRSAVLEVLSEDFIRTARAKGLRQQVITYKHALKNAMVPVITIVGLQLGYYLAGSVVIESVFGWPGMGRLAIDSILTHDFPLVQGVVLVFALSVVAVSLLVDATYALFDPRIRYD